MLTSQFTIITPWIQFFWKMDTLNCTQRSAHSCIYKWYKTRTGVSDHGTEHKIHSTYSFSSCYLGLSCPSPESIKPIRIALQEKLIVAYFVSNVFPHCSSKHGLHSVGLKAHLFARFQFIELMKSLSAVYFGALKHSHACAH